jgi:Bacteriophage Mu, GemA protein
MQTAEAGTAVIPLGAAAVPASQVKALAARVLNNRALFSDDMTQLQSMQLAMVGLAYGVDPFAGEIVLYEGKPLITIDGRIRTAIQSAAFDGIEYTRPADEHEREAFRVRDGEDMWVACVWRKNVRHPSVGYGRAGGPYERNALVTGSKRTGYNPERGPELARKRAIVNAMRYLFPLPRFDLGNAVAVETVDDDGAPLIGAVPTETPVPIQREQQQALHALARSLQLSDAEYRERLDGMFGVQTSKDLSAPQAAAVIEAFTDELAFLKQAEEARNAAPATPAPEPPGAPVVGPQDRAPIRNVPHPSALDAYVTDLTRAERLGLDLAHYAVDLSQITAPVLAALHDNLLAAIAAAEPDKRLEGM